MISPSELRIALPSSGADGKRSRVPSVTALIYRASASKTPHASPIDKLRTSGADLDATIILAPGAGAGQRHAFLVTFAEGLSALGLDVVTFDFPYREQGRRIPDRAPVLEACYRAAIGAVRDHLDSAARRLFIGGKSMGGRMATQVAAADPDLPIAGLVLLGYPLHPPNRPAVSRAAHLGSVGRPMLFVQGSRDGFGTPPELAAALAGVTPPPTLHVVVGGDHSLRVPGRDRAMQELVYVEVERTIAAWMRPLNAR